MLASGLSDPRRLELIRYQMPELLRERIYALALGYQAQDDVDRLAHDPAMRMATWDRPGDAVLEERLASQPTQSRLIDTLAHQEDNMEQVRHALGDWTERHLRCTSDHAVRRGTIGIDCFPLEVHLIEAIASSGRARVLGGMARISKSDPAQTLHVRLGRKKGQVDSALTEALTIFLSK